MVSLCATFGVACACHAASAKSESPLLGLQRDVVFDRYTPRAANSELVRRLLTPLAAYSVQRQLAAKGQALREQSIDLAAERFTLYVPARVPPEGYALLVFVPPWNEAILPPGWAPILESFGAIFVSAARSGNSENVIARREPLALLAVQNIVARFPIDPKNIVVGGFSGGSRVAMRLAVGYPDVFRGALLNAGSDPLGAGGAPVPPQDLFRRLQLATRIAYVTGSDDTVRLDMDTDSARSMRNWCVSVAATDMTPFRGHHVATASALAKTLGVLIERTSAPVDEAPSACRNSLEDKLPTAFDKAEFAIARGNRRIARDALLTIDAVYGGLAMPRLVELAERCDCGLFNP